MTKEREGQCARCGTGKNGYIIRDQPGSYCKQCATHLTQTIPPTRHLGAPRMRYVEFTVSDEALETAPSIVEFVRQYITVANTDGLAVADARIKSCRDIPTGTVTIRLEWPNG